MPFSCVISKTPLNFSVLHFAICKTSTIVIAIAQTSYQIKYVVLSIEMGTFRLSINGIYYYYVFLLPFLLFYLNNWRCKKKNKALNKILYKNEAKYLSLASIIFTALCSNIGPVCMKKGYIINSGSSPWFISNLI